MGLCAIRLLVRYVSALVHRTSPVVMIACNCVMSSVLQRSATIPRCLGTRNLSRSIMPLVGQNVCPHSMGGG